MTGLALATHERVVLADDDVRWEPHALERAAALLEQADLVRPQNLFEPLPWHARWDTARSLVNRALGADFPGTLAVRRSTVLDAGGYDADVLFENLELMRTVRAAGGVVRDAPDLYVRRLPPSTRHFLGQRVRQAYDSRAQPPRMLAELAVLPLVAAALARRRIGVVLAGVVGVVALAEVGRRRHGGRRHVPASCSWFAPAWVAERAVCSWLALGQAWRGGVPYAGSRFARAATPERVLRRRLAIARCRAAPD
jgi:hypothetical protein